MSHIPVLMVPVLKTFRKRTVTTFFDGTLGLGGHAAALLGQHPELQTYIGVDKDERALAIAIAATTVNDTTTLNTRRGCYGDVTPTLQRDALLGSPARLSGALLDLGVSSLQLDDGARGFSHSRYGALDMRMDDSLGMTAADVVQTYSEAALVRVLGLYGDVRKPRRLARSLVAARGAAPLRTTTQLVAALERHLPREPKGRRRELAKVFQSLRIAVNAELEVLRGALPPLAALLERGGALAVISFHSGEDRIVKHTFAELAAGSGGELLVATKRPVVADEAEREANPRSRSAKLRVLERRS